MVITVILMVLWRLSDDSLIILMALMIFWWFSHNSLIILWWFSDDFLMILMALMILWWRQSRAVLTVLVLTQVEYEIRTLQESVFFPRWWWWWWCSWWQWWPWWWWWPCWCDCCTRYDPLPYLSCSIKTEVSSINSRKFPFRILLFSFTHFCLFHIWNKTIPYQEYLGTIPSPP